MSRADRLILKMRQLAAEGKQPPVTGKNPNPVPVYRRPPRNAPTTGRLR